jgi:hypothetical protein
MSIPHFLEVYPQPYDVSKKSLKTGTVIGEKDHICPISRLILKVLYSEYVLFASALLATKLYTTLIHRITCCMEEAEKVVRAKSSLEGAFGGTKGKDKESFLVCPTISFDIFSSSDFDAEGYPVYARIGKVPNTLLLLTT